MKEARIIFAGGTAEDVDRRLENIASKFGGFTAWTAEGGYIGSDGKLIKEPVRVVDVAVEDTFDMAWLIGLQKGWIEKHNEECGYVRWPSGKVQLVD